MVWSPSDMGEALYARASCAIPDYWGGGASQNDVGNCTLGFLMTADLRLSE